MSSADENGNVRMNDVIDFLVNLKGKIGRRYDEKIKGLEDRDEAELLESSCFEDQNLIDSVINIIKDYSSQ